MRALWPRRRKPNQTACSTPVRLPHASPATKVRFEPRRPPATPSTCPARSLKTSARLTHQLCFPRPRFSICDQPTSQSARPPASLYPQPAANTPRHPGLHRPVYAQDNIPPTACEGMASGAEAGGGGISSLVFSAIMRWKPIPTPSMTASSTAQPMALFRAARTPPRTASEPPVRKPAITIRRGKEVVSKRAQNEVEGREGRRRRKTYWHYTGPPSFGCPLRRSRRC